MPAMTEAHRQVCEAAGRTRMTPTERLEARRECSRARSKQSRTEEARRYRLRRGQPPRLSPLKWQEAHPDLPIEIYHKEQADKKVVRDTEYYQTHKTERKAYSLKVNYGLSPAEYAAMVIIQNGRCAICGQLTQVLSVDHDHDTGKVRGLLCPLCNISIGQMGESPERLRKAAEYLEVHNAWNPG